MDANVTVKPGRRAALAGISIFIAGLAAPCLAGDYPNKIVRFVVAQGPGGVGDVIARTLSQKLTESLGQQFIVENRAGANGIIGVSWVVKAPPDGYTVLLGSSANLAINTALYKKLPYDAQADLVPVALLGKLYYAVLVPASSPAKTIGEFVSLAKARPKKLNYGSGGSAAQASIEIFNSTAGIQLTHVSYKSNGAALIDLLGGRLDLVFESLTTAAPHIKSGQVRALAVTSLERLPQWPDIPTVAESGYPGYELSAWVSVVAPNGTPLPVRETLSSELKKVLARPEVVEQFRTLGIDAGFGDSAQLAALLKTDIARYRQAVSDAGMTLE